MSDREHGFRAEPEPDMVLIRAERRETPAALTALGLVRVRIRMRSGAWRYDAVPTEAVTCAASPRSDETSQLRSDPARRSGS
jgi:hypothetical protein